MTTRTFYEFFAGAGMARAGLSSGWKCLFANDFDARKGLTYQANWGLGGELFVGDVRSVTSDMLSDTADLAWASFPCQDLSLAGGGAGLRGERSGTFYPFWEKIADLRREGRAPRIVALENVVGTLHSHGGKDFEAICRTYTENGYRFGAVVIDASLFVPQSRPRLFVVGVRDDVVIDESLVSDAPLAPFHTKRLVAVQESLPTDVRASWVWWNIPTPAIRTSTFADLIEENPSDVPWHSAEETEKVLSMMSTVNRAKVQAAKRSGRRMVGGIYKRTRPDESGVKVQRAEIRFDDVSGCLRTPAGGSSRQVIMVIDGDLVRSRLISSRETARLMGLADSYRLPKRYNEAYHLTGDGVAVPVVRHLASHVFEPLLEGVRGEKTETGVDTMRA